MAYELIETIEVGAGGASSIEFTSIPQDGVDLVCVLSGRATSTTTTLRFNSDTTDANYTRLTLRGTGNAVSTWSTNGSFVMLASATTQTADTFGNSLAYISNYTSSSDKSTSIDTVYENNATTANQYLVAYKYATSSPITAVTITDTVGTFVQYSTASLYKIY